MSSFIIDVVLIYLSPESKNNGIIRNTRNGYGWIVNRLSNGWVESFGGDFERDDIPDPGTGGTIGMLISIDGSVGPFEGARDAEN